jgi:hypothetical protein
MSASMGSMPGSLSFRRIVDVPFETCAAAFDPLQRAGQAGELRFGHSLLRGPVEHDRATDTYRIEVRLARGPLRPRLPMRLTIDRWSGPAARTALELIPGTRVRPAAAYFRAGHLLLDALTRRVSNLDDLQRQQRQVTGAPPSTPDRSATRQRTRSAEPAHRPRPSLRTGRQAARSRAREVV